MKKIIILLSLCISFTGFSQKVKDSVLSRKMDKYRNFSVSVPPSFDKNSKKTYPLLLLLDGDYLFDAFDGAMSYGNYWDDLPEAIIVGLHQNKDGERFDDCRIDKETGLPEGKGESFFEFIGGELLPYIQSKYKTGEFKMIAGHDVTAGYINLFLYKDVPLFNAYICLSPELSLEMETRIPARLAVQKNKTFYYLSSADGDVKKMKEDIVLLNNNIKTVTNDNLNYRYEEIKGATHYSLVLHSIPSALYQFFSSYQPISSNEFQEKIVKLQSGYVDYLKNKYDLLENTLGIKMPVRINDFRAIESAIVKNKAFTDFESLAQLAKKSYPRAMLGEYYMARYYENSGDIKRAVKSYQNAFTMEAIGALTKDAMLEKADELRSQLKK